MTHDAPAERSLTSKSIEPTNILGAALTAASMFTYITNDTEVAIRHFENIGIGPWGSIEGPASDDSSIRARFAFMVGRMIEVVEPLRNVPEAPAGHPDPESFAANIRAERAIWPPLEADHFVVTLHQVGAFMDVRPQQVIDAATSAGLHYEVLSQRDPAPGAIVLVDTRDTAGHWVKVLCSSDLETGATQSADR